MPQRYDATHCQVVTTVGSREAADALAQGAVMARVAACAQVGGPINSTYWWDGEPQQSEEWPVVFKTTVERYPDLEAFVLDNHDYDVPEVLAVPIMAGNPAYLAWVSEETRRS